MTYMLDSDWLKTFLLRSDWLPTEVALYTTAAVRGTIQKTAPIIIVKRGIALVV